MTQKPKMLCRKPFCDCGSIRSVWSLLSKQKQCSPKTVRNLSIDEVRKRRSHPTADWEQVSNQQFTSEEEDEVDEITLRLQRIEKLMDECLSLVQQQVLRMRDVDGRTYAEIAQHLNMQENCC